MTPPVSKIRKLPPELREMVNEMLDQGVSVADIADRLRSFGQDVSASGVGRYRLDWRESVKDLAEAREFAEVVVRNMAEQPEGKGARLNAELIQGALFSSLVAMRAKNLEPDQAIPLLLKGAMTQQMISRAAKDDTDMQIKSAEYREARQAKDGDLLTKRDGKLVRVELVEPQKGPEKAGNKAAKALPATPKKAPARNKEASS